MSTHVLATKPNRYGDVGHFETDTVFSVYSRLQRHVTRFKPFYVSAEGRVHQGPMEPGPYAYAVALASCIDTRGGTAAESEKLRAQGLEFSAEIGDLFVIGDEVFRLVDDKPHHDPYFKHIAG